jgi:hypothetical protein
MDQTKASVPVVFPAAVAVCVLLLTSWAWSKIDRWLKFRKFPLLDFEYTGRPEHFMFQCEAMYQAGYDKFRNDVHRISTPDGTIPSRFKTRWQADMEF